MDPVNVFREQLAPEFPFVVIQEHVTSMVLSQAKPFLYKAISLPASYNDLPRQVALGQELREYLGLHMFTRGEKDLDLLQGLLVSIAWYQYHLSVNLQLTNLIHLAMALVVDLGLNRRTHGSDRHKAAIGGLSAIPSEDEAPPHLPSTLDGPRAYLGCLYLSSVISICIKKRK